MKQVTLEELLEAGCHFGHQVTRQNPKARDFIFEARDGIHIIDLVKTKEGLDEAYDFVKSIASKDSSNMLIVGTKRQAQPIIDEELKKAKNIISSKKIDSGLTGAEDKPLDPGLFYVTKHWVGGILTNFSAVQKNFEKLHDLEDNLQDEEEKEKFTKKEIGLWDKERQKLDSFYSGVAYMKKMPDVLFVVDTHQELLAVREANRMGIPVVGIVDTNADPDNINYVIPSNDDAVGALKLLISHILEAWIEGKTLPKDKGLEIKDKKEVAKETTSTSNPSVNSGQGTTVARETEETKVAKKPAKPVEKQVKKAKKEKTTDKTKENE